MTYIIEDTTQWRIEIDNGILFTLKPYGATARLAGQDALLWLIEYQQQVRDFKDQSTRASRFTWNEILCEINPGVEGVG